MKGRARVALNLRRLRVARGITQESLAFDAKVAVPYISGIEQGSRNPSLDVLDRLAKALGIDLCELVALTDNAAEPPLKAGRKRKG